MNPKEIYLGQGNSDCVIHITSELRGAPLARPVKARQGRNVLVRLVMRWFRLLEFRGVWGRE